MCKHAAVAAGLSLGPGTHNGRAAGDGDVDEEEEGGGRGGGRLESAGVQEGRAGKDAPR